MFSGLRHSDLLRSIPSMIVTPGVLFAARMPCIDRCHVSELSRLGFKISLKSRGVSTACRSRFLLRLADSRPSHWGQAPLGVVCRVPRYQWPLISQIRMDLASRKTDLYVRILRGTPYSVCLLSCPCQPHTCNISGLRSTADAKCIIPLESWSFFSVRAIRIPYCHIGLLPTIQSESAWHACLAMPLT